MWYTLAFASALMYSFRGVLEKGIVHKTDKYVLGLGVRLFALPFFFIPLVLSPQLIPAPSELGWGFWAPLLILCLISTPLENWFYYEALKEEELSLALPILSLAPVVTIGIAATVLHDIPTWLGVAGVLLIVAGVYALKIGHAREGLLEPLRHLRRSRGVQLMLVVMLSLGFSSVLDKMGVQASNPFFFAAANYSLLCVVLFVMAWVKSRRHLGQLGRHAGQFSLIGLVVAGYTILYMMALSDGIASYVIAIRNASILFTIVLGVLLLREKGLKSKLLAGALIFAGLVCIKVFG